MPDGRENSGASPDGEVERAPDVRTEEDDIDVAAVVRAHPDEARAALDEVGDGKVADGGGGQRIDEQIARHDDALADALDTVARLQRQGTLDELAAVGDAVAMMGDALDDDMVTSVASTAGSLGEVADEAADPGVRDGLAGTIRAMGTAFDEEPREVGVFGMLRALRDPDVKRSLGFALTLARAMGEELEDGD
ncbi:MAG: DUF1641 domain-containing protein [Halobacteriales archaeon]